MAATVTLPSGGQFDRERPRSAGVLSSEELAFCKAQGWALAYDPLQMGWIVANAPDDVAPARSGDDPRGLLAGLLQDVSQRLDALAAGDSSVSRAQVYTLVSEVIRRHPDHAASSPEALETLNTAHLTLLSHVERWLRETSQGAPPGSVRAAPRFDFRPWADTDLEAYEALFGNPKVWQYLTDAPSFPLSPQQCVDMMAVAQVEGHHEVRAVTQDGAIIGQVRLVFDEGAATKRAEVAYVLAESHWGRKLMHPVLSEYLRASIEAHQLELVYAWIHPENVASVKVATAAGFVRDSFARESALAELAGRPGFQRYLRFVIR